MKFETRYDGQKGTDWVLIAPRGEAMASTQTWHRVEKVRPPTDWDDRRKDSDTFRDMEAKWSVIGPAYDAFLANTEIPLNGIPLAGWSGVTPEQADVLRGIGYKTVEDVADMGESAASKLPWPGGSKLMQLAKSYLDGRDKAQVSEDLARANERIAAMEEMLAEQTKPKRGRPKKEPVEQGEAA